MRRFGPASSEISTAMQAQEGQHGPLGGEQTAFRSSERVEAYRPDGMDARWGGEASPYRE
jgi:hypothetical protein